MELIVYRPGLGYVSLGEGPISLTHGQTLLVGVTFDYICNTPISISFRLSVGTAIGEEDFEEVYHNDHSVDLPISTFKSQASAVIPLEIRKTPITYPLPPLLGLDPGTYDLKVEALGYTDVYDIGRGVLVVTEEPGLLSTIASMIPMVVMLMMMGMIMPMVSGLNESPAGSPEGGA